MSLIKSFKELDKIKPDYNFRRKALGAVIDDRLNKIENMESPRYCLICGKNFLNFYESINHSCPKKFIFLKNKIRTAEYIAYIKKNNRFKIKLNGLVFYFKKRIDATNAIKLFKKEGFCMNEIQNKLITKGL